MASLVRICLQNQKKQNEKDAWLGAKRDQVQRNNLIKAQMKDRRILQRDIEKLRRKHTQNRSILAREVMQAMQRIDQRDQEQTQNQERQRILERYHGPSL